MELLPSNVAAIAIAAYRAAGYQVRESTGGGMGRFYRYDITAPTGEEFVIVVEEVF